jgi:hypothetical protein
MSSGLWRRVILWYDTKVSEDFLPPSSDFTLKKDAARASETLVSYNHHQTRFGLLRIYFLNDGIIFLKMLSVGLCFCDNMKFPVLKSHM